LRSELYDKSELTDDFIRVIVRVNRTLPGYKKIRDFTIRKEEFEKTSSRKIKRLFYLRLRKRGYSRDYRYSIERGRHMIPDGPIFPPSSPDRA